MKPLAQMCSHERGLALDASLSKVSFGFEYFPTKSYAYKITLKFTFDLGELSSFGIIFREIFFILLKCLFYEIDCSL